MTADRDVFGVGDGDGVGRGSSEARPGPSPPRVPARGFAGMVLAVAVLVLAVVSAYLVVGRNGSPASTQSGNASASSAARSGSEAPARPEATGAARPSAPVPGGPGATAAPRPAGPARDPVSGLPWIAESALPSQARDTLRLIRAGGPYPYPRNDDQTFGNREGLLPRQPPGYYREYTVPTPGESDRGPRRIVAGRAGERYYTGDHYRSFSRIEEGR